MKRMRGVLLALLLVLACAQAGAGETAPGYKVLDVFEVGQNVYVRALAVEPRTKSLWVGTSVGLHEIDLERREPRQTFTRKDGLANEYVFAIGIDREGYKWFGTNAGGASRYKDGRWKTYFPMHGLADYWIYAFASQKNGDLWIGTWAGANKFDLRTRKFTTYKAQLINEWVYGIAVDARDRVWFGTEGGVTRFDGKQWRSWTHTDGLGAPNHASLPPSPNTGLGTRSRHDLSTLVEGGPSYNPNYVFAILAARDGSVWAGTWGGGVSRFDGERWTSFSSQEGLAGDIVYSMAQEPSGALWFGTNHGVSRFDGKAWQSIRAADGLLDDNVYALAIAPGGEVWAGTRRGVARIGAANPHEAKR
jgi:ligand-binding sensor domain-containing protein